MFKVVEGNSQGLADADEFMRLINAPPAELCDFFDRESDILVSRAPGRLDVMGGIADYSGSLVLEMPIAESTFVAVQKTDDARISIASLQPASRELLTFGMGLDVLAVDARRCYEIARNLFRRAERDQWASYVAGTFFVLQREIGARFECGARLLIASEVPVGKGVSSSAAIEVATMQSVCFAYNIELDARRIALLCQKVENRIVGAPCGVMDQITASCGAENSLISLLCQRAEIQGMINIPDGIEFWGIDSGVRHAVSGSDYTSVRTGAFMGYRIIADLAGLRTRTTGREIVEIEDGRWRGYLANISPAEYEDLFAANIPEEMTGIEFIERYQGITDDETEIDPRSAYAVRGPTAFPIYENDRVTRFSHILKGSDVVDRLDLLGSLMLESHAGYAACGLTESGTNRLVDMVREAHGEGLFGARITGGGSGGTVAVLGRSGCRPVVDKIASEYQKETGRKPYVFTGSSPGCGAFGTIRLAPWSNDA